MKNMQLKSLIIVQLKKLIIIAILLTVIIFVISDREKLRDIQDGQKRTEHSMVHYKTEKRLKTKQEMTRIMFGNRRVTNATKIWISMGLCFTKNTELHGKVNYPYAQVLPLSVLLWLHFYPSNIRVILYLIKSKEDNQKRMTEYEKALRQIVKGVKSDRLVINWVDTGDMNCVTKSQTIRMWAFEHPNVSEHDLVITSDADAFVYNKSSLSPIYDEPNKLVWVFQYARTEEDSANFPMTWVAAYADVWRAIVDPAKSDRQSLDQNWLELSLEDAGGKSSQTMWNYDQLILTYGILKNSLCTVPRKSSLWNNLKLRESGINPETFSDDELNCWHGGWDYRDCNKELPSLKSGCKWWHFFPSQRLSAHIDVFNKLTHDYYPKNHYDVLRFLN